MLIAMYLKSLYLLIPIAVLPLASLADDLPLQWKTEATKRRASQAGSEIKLRSGEGMTVNLVPESSDHFDLSAYSYLRLKIRNNGSSLVWIEGRLDNEGAENWKNSSSSQTFALPGETTTLGFAYPRPRDSDDAPDIFEGMASKPNGWRSHWIQFNPAQVKRIRLRIHSLSPVDLDISDLTPSQPYGAKTNADLLQLPFLDEFGQVHQKTWKGKRAALDASTEQLTPNATFNQYGGWENGPRYEATGHFRTQKIDDTWWFIDPTGCLFWSHGVSAVGYGLATPLNDGRRALFKWVPEKNDPLYESAITAGKKATKINFLQANLHRLHGEKWKTKANLLTHKRLRAWGINTIGAWSNTELQQDRRTPYTPIFHVGYPQLDGKIPQPFGPALKRNTLNTIRKWKQKNTVDAFVLGAFIDNEIHWPSNLAELIFKQDVKHPAREAAIEFLRKKHLTLEALNVAWQTKHTSWEFTPSPTEQNKSDLERIKERYADKFYQVCRDALREELPGILYLGSRIHACPPYAARAAAKHVDVFSINHYWNRAGLGTAAHSELDVPIIITEFHFGATDRGVLGASLSPIDNQKQRARAYANYVLSALHHPRIIGTHHFQWYDQSSAGRPGENYQIGFLDVTDSPYPEFTEAVTQLAKVLYNTRQNPPKDVLQSLEETIELGKKIQ